MRAEQIKQMIEVGLPGSQVQVFGDDGQHFDAIVVADVFEGKAMLQQHRLVYAALGGKVEDGSIHALALKTYSPQAWAKHKNDG